MVGKNWLDKIECEKLTYFQWDHLLEELVERVINAKAEINNNNMAYGYYPKFLKD